MKEPLFRTYKRYSGYLVRGGIPVAMDSAPLRTHMMRVLWLVTQVETGGVWGTVQNYDGCAMSAGLIHSTAVLPRSNEQGVLWDLLNMIRLAAPDSEALIEILDSFKNLGWYLDGEGALRHTHNGSKVSGLHIQTELSGTSGTQSTPEEHSRAQRYALQFSEVFSNPKTFPVQIQHAVNWICRGNQAGEVSAYRRVAPNAMESMDSWRVLSSHQLPSEFDLAMCVYHSHSVNSPLAAKVALQDAFIFQHYDTPRFARAVSRRLVWNLGKSTHGRWADNPHDVNDVGNRYDKTRLAVMRSGFWAPEVVQDVMPSTLPDTPPV